MSHVECGQGPQQSAASAAFAQRVLGLTETCPVVVFDLGGVLVDHDNHVLAARLSAACGSARASPGLLAAAIAGSGTTTGACTVPEFHARLVDELALRLDYQEFVAVWNSHLAPLTDAIASLGRLANARRLFVLSNTNREHWRFISETMLDARFFEGILLSYELRAQKPDPLIYEQALQAIGSPASSCALIDDAPQNVAAARALGMRGILCRTGRQAGGQVTELIEAHPADLGISARAPAQLLDEFSQGLFDDLDELASVRLGRADASATDRQKCVTLDGRVGALERIAERDPLASDEACLLSQLARSGGGRGFVTIDSAGRQLIQDRVGPGAILAGQDHARLVGEGQHGDDPPLAFQGESALRAVGQLEGDVLDPSPGGVNVDATMERLPTLDAHVALRPAARHAASIPWRERVVEGMPLAAFTTLGLGGPASFMFDAETLDEALAALRWASDLGVRVVVLGSGSNVVVSDAGFDGLVLRLRARRLRVTWSGDEATLIAQAGLSLDELVAQSVHFGLSGMECLSGIPGTVGAAPVQNVSAYGQQLADVLNAVQVFDRQRRELVMLSAAECRLAHRSSEFKRSPDRWVILAATFKLRRCPHAHFRYAEVERRLAGRPASPGLVRETVLAIRREKSMLLDRADPNSRSVGSFFVSPVLPSAEVQSLVARAVRCGLVQRAEDVPVVHDSERCRVPGGWLIERSGYRKGQQARGVGISSRHALSLVHYGQGSTQALLQLAASIQRDVKATFGDIWLEPEPTFIGTPNDLTRRLWENEVS